MSDELRTQKGAISKLAQAFATEAADLGSALPGFESDLYSVHDAFGPWGVSQEMLQEYLDTAYEALKGLNSLRSALANDAERLSAAESNYDQAESSSTYPPGG